MRLFRLSNTNWLSLRLNLLHSCSRVTQVQDITQTSPGKLCGDGFLAVHMSLCFWTEQRHALCFHYSHVYFWVWRKCGWCKKNCVMTPLWLTDPTQGPPCVGYNHRVPHMTSQCSHNSSFYHLEYINIVHMRNIRTMDYALTMSWFQLCVGKGGGYVPMLCRLLKSACLLKILCGECRPPIKQGFQTRVATSALPPHKPPTMH